MSGESFSKLMADLLRKSFSYVNSDSNDKVLATVHAMTKLVEIDCSSETRMMAQLRIPLVSGEIEILLLASDTLGEIVKKKESEIGDSTEGEMLSAFKKLRA